MAVLLYKNFGQGDLSWLKFFMNATYIVAALGLVICMASLIYFKSKYKKVRIPPEPQIHIV